LGWRRRGRAARLRSLRAASHSHKSRPNYSGQEEMATFVECSDTPSPSKVCESDRAVVAGRQSLGRRRPGRFQRQSHFCAALSLRRDALHAAADISSHGLSFAISGPL